MDKARLIVAARLLAAAGIAALGIDLIATSWPPVVRHQGERAYADIRRALTPLVNFPADDFQGDRRHDIRFTVPDDDQWRRIRQRMGAPKFVIVVATDPELRDRTAYSATDAGLSATATANGRTLAITRTTKLPYTYWGTGGQDARTFSANASDAVSLSIHISSANLPQDSRLMIFAVWNGLETWHWVDSHSMGQGLAELFAPYLVGIGCLMLLLAIRVGLVRQTS